MIFGKEFIEFEYSQLLNFFKSTTKKKIPVSTQKIVYGLDLTNYKNNAGNKKTLLLNKFKQLNE